MSPVSEQAERAAALPQVHVTRSRRPATWAGLAGLVLVIALFLAPYEVHTGTTNMLVNVFILMTMASMWNLLAGYAGLVSVGQQAFVGLGAYFVLALDLHGVNPFLGLVLAAGACAVIGLPVWWLVSRLRTAYFAIATWVVASVCYLIIVRFPSLGGGTGEPLTGPILSMNPTLLNAFTYWAALAVAVATLAVIYLMLRSRLGLVLTAVRDDEVGARSLGARVSRAQRTVFVVAAAGCGAAGALFIISQLSVDPASAFNVSWSAEMIFATIIGGIGTIEGPIIGTIVFFVLQQTLSSYGTWYFMILGAVAIAIAIWSRHGLWGILTDHVHIRIFPVGYWLWADAASAPGRFGLPRRRGGSEPPAPPAAPDS